MNLLSFLFALLVFSTLFLFRGFVFFPMTMTMVVIVIMRGLSFAFTRHAPRRRFVVGCVKTRTLENDLGGGDHFLQ